MDIGVEWKLDRKAYKEKGNTRMMKDGKTDNIAQKKTKRKGGEGEANRKGKEKKTCSLRS